ncbi:hypothetical protein E4198_24650 [Streptomyces sp. RKND-216]|uniref:hypothetical protein n=1 Tax=Streptomyces sp. RKND-216 TaxID=2562581 RepID=UPI00109DC16F|nr:hypothetical protein [Streptomyces sp. RKND-216]THA23378.1 hypothetical protein E4198_00255 [Streptomyces sp. RKND-216]THA27416.1 hypothetical protein E4198_24650 [Streptomyces sp. RKND-216]
MRNKRLWTATTVVACSLGLITGPLGMTAAADAKGAAAPADARPASQAFAAAAAGDGAGLAPGEAPNAWASDMGKAAAAGFAGGVAAGAVDAARGAIAGVSTPTDAELVDERAFDAPAGPNAWGRDMASAAVGGAAGALGAGAVDAARGAIAGVSTPQAEDTAGETLFD